MTARQNKTQGTLTIVSLAPYTGGRDLTTTFTNLQPRGLLDSKSYGIAMAQGSELRALVSSAIIKLREEGVIASLKKKWWQEERGGGACQAEETAAGGVSELSLENFGGIFLVLLIGLLIGGLLALLERYWIFCRKQSFSI